MFRTEEPTGVDVDGDGEQIDVDMPPASSKNLDADTTGNSDVEDADTEINVV
jgi:hypothetical protein